MKNLDTLINDFANGDLIIQFTNKKHIRPIIDLVYDKLADDYAINTMMDIIGCDYDDDRDYVVDCIADHMCDEWDKYGSSTAFRVKDNDIMYKNIEKHIAKQRAYVTSNQIIVLADLNKPTIDDIVNKLKGKLNETLDNFQDMLNNIKDLLN